MAVTRMRNIGIGIIALGVLIATSSELFGVALAGVFLMLIGGALYKWPAV